jgi:hypothetical protein
MGDGTANAPEPQLAAVREIGQNLCEFFKALHVPPCSVPKLREVWQGWFGYGKPGLGTAQGWIQQSGRLESDRAEREHIVAHRLQIQCDASLAVVDRLHVSSAPVVIGPGFDDRSSMGPGLDQDGNERGDTGLWDAWARGNEVHVRRPAVVNGWPLRWRQRTYVQVMSLGGAVYVYPALSEYTRSSCTTSRRRSTQTTSRPSCARRSWGTRSATPRC